MLTSGRIILTCCLGFSLVTTVSTTDNTVARPVDLRTPQLTCSKQSGTPKPADCWDALKQIPVRDSTRWIFGPTGSVCDYETPKFFLHNNCAIGIYNSPLKNKRDISDWFPIRMAVAKIIDRCVEELNIGGYYQGWGYAQNLMVVIFYWNPKFDIEKMPSVIEAKNRVQGSCEAAVAATPPSRGNTASVSDCSLGNSGKKQCLKGASSSPSAGYCRAGNNDDCCQDYTCVPTTSSNSEILLGYLSATVSLVGQCLTVDSSKITTVKREDDVTSIEPRNQHNPVSATHEMSAPVNGPQNRIGSSDGFGIPDNRLARYSKLTQHPNFMHYKRQAQRRRGILNKRTDDPFCNIEYGSPNPDDCDKAWLQIPSDYTQRWFFNGNYNALPGRGTIKPLENLPQLWQSGNCRIQVKFTLDEELASEPERSSDDEEFHQSARAPFAYRPFDETSWDAIDDGALDIISHCVNHPSSGLGGTDLAVSQYKKIEINVYSLDSLYNKEQEAAQAAASPNAQNQAGAGQTDTVEGPGTPQKPEKPFRMWGSPQTSPYWFMQNCHTGAIYCTRDIDCGAACGPSQSCKVFNLLNRAIMTGVQALSTRSDLGSCYSA